MRCYSCSSPGRSSRTASNESERVRSRPEGVINVEGRGQLPYFGGSTADKLERQLQAVGVSASWSLHLSSGVDRFNLAGGVVADDFDGDGGFTARGHEAGFSGLYGGLNLLQADDDHDGGKFR